MKKQSGFTLIELLLVLAIIGIISAIAIPALLGQRARARDKAAVANCDVVLSDLVGQWDKHREEGATASGAIASINTYLNNNYGQSRNPWNGDAPAFASALAATGGALATASAFGAAITVGSQGKVMLGYQAPAGAGLTGFMGAAVQLNGTINNSNIYHKVTAIE